MEDGQRAVGILVHPDRGLDVVAAMAVGGELQEPALSREDGYNAAKQQLTAHPDTTIWLSYSNDNMKGVYKALTDAGVANDDPSYFLAGMDVTNEDLDLIQLPNSIYRMAFAFRSETLATVNENFLVAAAEGQPLEDVFVYPELVTPETAKNFYVGNVRH